MAHVLRSARTQRAATSVFVLKVFTLLVSHMGQSVLPRVRAHHSHTGEKFFANVPCIKLPIAFTTPQFLYRKPTSAALAGQRSHPSFQSVL